MNLCSTREPSRFSGESGNLPVPAPLLGTLRSGDNDGRENVAEKVRSFNLHRD